MVVDPGVSHRRRRNRLACRARRRTVRAGRLRGTPYVEEATFALARAASIGGTAATGKARVFVHLKTRRNRQVLDIFCDSSTLDGALRGAEPEGAAFLTYGRVETVGVGCPKPGETE